MGGPTPSTLDPIPVKRKFRCRKPRTPKVKGFSITPYLDLDPYPVTVTHKARYNRSSDWVTRVTKHLAFTDAWTNLHSKPWNPFVGWDYVFLENDTHKISDVEWKSKWTQTKRTLTITLDIEVPDDLWQYAWTCQIPVTWTTHEWPTHPNFDCTITDKNTSYKYPDTSIWAPVPTTKCASWDIDIYAWATVPTLPPDDTFDFNDISWPEESGILLFRQYFSPIGITLSPYYPLKKYIYPIPKERPPHTWDKLSPIAPPFNQIERWLRSPCPWE